MLGVPAGVPANLNDDRAAARSAAAFDMNARWTVLERPAELEPWARAIDELCERQRLPALASWSWQSAFWEGFFEGHADVSLHLCHRGNQVLAAIPVRRLGRLVRKVQGLENEHFVYWACPADTSDPQLGERLLDHLLPGADLLELRRLPLDGPLGRALTEAARRRGLPVIELENAEGEVAVPLLTPYSEFEKTVSKNLRRDGRLVTKLEALGKVEFQVVEAPEALGAELAACLELEAQGWKGLSGSPVLANPGTHRFYRALAERAARAGQLRLYLLKLDGRLIAFEYDLCAGGRVECLKIAYDESLARFSPGTILRLMLLRQVIERGEASEYHLGRVSAWKRRWMKREDRIGTLQIFSGSARGRLAHAGGPLLRRALKQVPGVRPLVDRLLRRTPEPPASAPEVHPPRDGGRS